MLRNDRKIINSSLIVAFFLVIAYFLRTNPMRIDDVFINAIMIATRNVIHITLLVAWYY
ncbi:MAG: hypothetical protein IKU60_02635 [Clostridia bacterium]|nr:hypothetical protein [Clostridia bacterium]